MHFASSSHHQPGFSPVAFSRMWHLHCHHWQPELLSVCLSGTEQTQVECRSRKHSMASFPEDPITHSSGARCHMGARLIEDLEDDSFHGFVRVMTAGFLQEYAYPDASLLRILAGRILVIVHNPAAGLDATQPVFCVASAGDRVIFRPGIRWTVYAIEPTILSYQAFLDYRCLELSVREAATIESQASAVYMALALLDPIWTATLDLGDERYLHTLRVAAKQIMDRLVSSLIAKHPQLADKRRRIEMACRRHIIPLYALARRAASDLEKAIRESE